jgi:hypothetical protein
MCSSSFPSLPAWMLQQAQNVLDGARRPWRAGALLIHDRDKKFPRAFDAIFAAEGISVIRTPFQARRRRTPPRALVGSIRRNASTDFSLRSPEGDPSLAREVDRHDRYHDREEGSIHAGSRLPRCVSFLGSRRALPRFA